jgi:hypothetical protein
VNQSVVRSSATTEVETQQGLRSTSTRRTETGLATPWRRPTTVSPAA